MSDRENLLFCWVALAIFASVIVFLCGYGIGEDEGEASVWAKAFKAGAAIPVVNRDTGEIEFEFAVGQETDNPLERDQ